MIALEQALEIIEGLSTEQWTHEDDLCDCTFQRIGYWYNPYIGESLEVRMCCIWKELYKQFPEFVRTSKHEPAEWNGEADMPRSVWHRQLANSTGVSITEAREMNIEAPKGKPRQAKPRMLLQWSGEWIEVTLG
jgi:hypothetical protein